jgi:sugar lactone lactonase YvrE
VTLRGPRARIPERLRDSALRHVADEFRNRVPSEYAWYRALRVDDQNNLWVERDVAGGRRFDVYAPDGRLLAEVAVPPALDTDARSGFGRLVLAHGRVYGFVKDADDVAYLVAWRIVR